MEQETPICIYNALKIYATVRCETLIDCFLWEFELPTRVCDSKKNMVGTHAHTSTNLVRKGIFTAIAKDNIDLNSSSTTHYHGTCISIRQVPTRQPYTYTYQVRVM